MSLPLGAQNKSNVKHKKALVFLQGATLTAYANPTLTSGKNTIVIGGLSGLLQRESVRIKSDGIKINSFSHQLNYLEYENRNKTILNLKNEQEELNNSSSRIRQQITILTQERDMILSNKTVAGQENGLEPAKLKELAEFYRLRLNDILTKQLGLEVELKNITNKLTKVNAQITTTSGQIIIPSAEIEIQLEASKSGAQEIQIEYFIEEAGWIPTYDFRVQALNANYQIDYLASIYQNSGFDWNQMEVAVSSADPSNTLSGINLKPWYVNLQSYKLNYDLVGSNQSNTMSGYIFSQHGEPIPFANLKIENSSIGTISNEIGSYSLQLNSNSQMVKISALGYEPITTQIYPGKRNFYLQQNNIELSDAVVVLESKNSGKVKSSEKTAAEAPSAGYANTRFKDAEILESNTQTTKTAVNVEYALKDKIDIKSDGKPLNFLIQKIELPGEYSSVVYPKINSNAFLHIYLQNWEKLNLLEGEANLYFANSYIGKSSLNLTQVGDSLKFNFGKDPNIKTIRSLTNSKTSNIALSSNKQSEYRWSTELKNLANYETTISVVEPFPISQNKEIKVDLDKELSGAQVNMEKGTMTWTITLKPGETKKISYGYSLVYPKSMQIRID